MSQFIIPTVDQQELESFDLVDEHDQPLGQTKARNLVHQDGDWHRAVHVWIVNSRNEILLQKRGSKKKQYRDLWHLTLGGHVAAGGDLIDTCRRELFEELGIQIEQSELKYLFTVKWKSDPSFPFKDYEFNYVYLIRKDVSMFEIRINKEEVSDFKYVTIAEFSRMLDQEPEKLLPQYEEYRKVIDYLKKLTGK